MDIFTDIGIVCSHPKETRKLASVLKKARKERFSLFHGYTGILQGYRCVIIESGKGGNRAFVAAKQVFALFGPRIILDFGVAAGVHPDLRPGSVFFAQKISELFLSEMGRMKGLAFGTVGSAEFHLANSQVRGELFRRGIDLFDYESFSVIKAAAENSALYMSLRGVSDCGDENAQKDFQKNLDQALSATVDYLLRILEILSDFI